MKQGALLCYDIHSYVATYFIKFHPAFRNKEIKTLINYCSFICHYVISEYCSLLLTL